MRYDPERHRRRSIRLRGYDYSQAGAYFVTISTQDWACLLGEVVEGEMVLNAMGQIVARTWHDLPNHVCNVVLDAFIVMPNHVHGVVIITDSAGTDSAGTDSAGTGSAGTGSVGAGSEPAPTMNAPPKSHKLSEIILQLKTFSARRINELRGTSGQPVWQRNYYEHIIRNEQSLTQIRQYITENPLRWAFDRENPAVIAPEPENSCRQ